MENQNPILVSACLLGEPCRYDGSSHICDVLVESLRTTPMVPICPELLGGLETPRVPCEIAPSGRVIDADGNDRTEAYDTGARLAVEIARAFGCTTAILKSKSPSCGVHQVYDGSFSHNLVDGRGIAAAALQESGIAVFDEDDFKAGNVPSCLPKKR